MKKILIALLGILLLANVGFATTDTGLVTLSAVTPVLTVAIDDVAFGAVALGYGYVKAVGALTFNTNVNWTLKVQSSTRGLEHTNATDRIILKCYYNLEGTPSPDPTVDNWMTEWKEVLWTGATQGDWLQLGTGTPIDKTVDPLPTLDFATEITATTPEGDYSTTVTLEILSV